MKIFFENQHPLLLQEHDLFLFRKKIARKKEEIEQRSVDHSIISPARIIKEFNKCTSIQKAEKIAVFFSSIKYNTVNIMIVITKLMEYASLQPIFRTYYSHIFRKWYSISSFKSQILSCLNLYMSLLFVCTNNQYVSDNEYLNFCTTQKQKKKIVGSHEFLYMLFNEGLSDCKFIIDNQINNEIIPQSLKNSTIHLEILIAVIPQFKKEDLQKQHGFLQNVEMALRKNKNVRSRLLLINSIEAHKST